MGSDQEKTFGPTISNLIKKNLYPNRVTLWDSKARGTRPDSVKVIKDIYQAWGMLDGAMLFNLLTRFKGAEVVIITSNAQGNKEMTEGLTAAGIPNFVGGRLFSFPISLTRSREHSGISDSTLTFL